MTLKHFLIAARNAIAFKALPLPAAVHFIGRGRMFVDLGDFRGRRVREWVGSTRYRNTWLWRSAVRAMRPDLALDIGANYGEIALSSDYPEDCTVILVEANRKLAGILERSVRTRARFAGNWRVVNAAAADRAGTAEFFVDEVSSGTSRLNAGSAARQGRRVERVDLIRVEDLPDVRSPRRLVFKIDVEGAEVSALKGMLRCLQGTTAYLGIVELSEANLRESGSSPHELWELVRSYGRVALFNEDDQLVDCSDLDWEGVAAHRGARKLRFNYATDLVMYRAVPDVELLAPARRRRRIERLIKKLMPSLSAR